MPRRVSVLCPIDFSVASLGALRYAAAIAERFDGELTVVTVEDPLLASMDAAAGESWHGGETRRELSRVVADVLGRRSDMPERTPRGRLGPARARRSCGSPTSAHAT